jgi:hypothetical protein
MNEKLCQSKSCLLAIAIRNLKKMTSVFWPFSTSSVIKIGLEKIILMMTLIVVLNGPAPLDHD